MKNIYEVLKNLNIAYEKYDHPAVFTVEEAKRHYRGDFGENKNLFLKSKKGDSFYLVVLESDKRLDLKKFASFFNENKLSFASPQSLFEFLNLTPGSVSPFGIINDASKSVKVIIDNGLLKYEKLGFHPNINTSTLIIKTNDFKKFLDQSGNIIIYVDL